MMRVDNIWVVAGGTASMTIRAIGSANYSSANAMSGSKDKAKR